MKNKFLALLILFALSNISCSVYNALVNLSRLKFKLGNVNGFAIDGISIANKSKLSDFSLTEGLKLTSSFAQGKLPVSFTLNVEAQNPNDGTGGTKQSTATLKSFPWRLLINDKETISGNIGAPVVIPGTGQTSVIPLQMNLDLITFFKDKSYNDIIDLVLNLGGKSSSSSKLTLFAQPTVTSPLGDIKYPNELKIVDHQFTN
jgi:hypothetical protein